MEASKKTETKLPDPAKPEKPEGWWDLRDLHGSLEGICKAIESRADVPEFWRKAIIADVRAKCGDRFNSVWVDAHFMGRKDNGTLHYTMTASKMLI